MATTYTQQLLIHISISKSKLTSVDILNVMIPCPWRHQCCHNKGFIVKYVLVKTVKVRYRIAFTTVCHLVIPRKGRLSYSFVFDHLNYFLSYGMSGYPGEGRISYSLIALYTLLRLSTLMNVSGCPSPRVIV